jgi:hypothetical protein
MLTLDVQLRIPAYVSSNFVDEDAVLLNTRTNQYFALEAVSARTWRLIQAGLDLRACVRTLQSEYDVQTDELERDVLDLVRELLENGLLELDER